MRIFRRNFLVMLIAIKFRVKFTKMGKDRDQRVKRDARKMIGLIVPSLEKATKNRAAHMLKRFLFLHNINRQVKDGVIETVKQIRNIQRKFRKRKEILKNR